MKKLRQGIHVCCRRIERRTESGRLIVYFLDLYA